MREERKERRKVERKEDLGERRGAFNINFQFFNTVGQVEAGSSE